MRRLLPSALLCLVLLASACKGQPLPADKAEFAGQWRGVGVELEIRSEGHVRFRKAQGQSTVKIEGPLQGWQGDDFVVGVMVVKTKFHVTETPHLVDGEWMMTVDGVELTRVGE